MFLIAYMPIIDGFNPERNNEVIISFTMMLPIFFTFFRVVNIFNLPFIWINQLKTEFITYLHCVCQYFKKNIIIL